MREQAFGRGLEANTLHDGWPRITLLTKGNGALVDDAYTSVAGAATAAGDPGEPATVPEPYTYARVGAELPRFGALVRHRLA